MIDELEPEARAFIARALREEAEAEPAELARIHRRVLAAGVGVAAWESARSALATGGKALFAGHAVLKALVLGWALGSIATLATVSLTARRARSQLDPPAVSDGTPQQPLAAPSAAPPFGEALQPGFAAPETAPAGVRLPRAALAAARGTALEARPYEPGARSAESPALTAPATSTPAAPARAVASDRTRALPSAPRPGEVGPATLSTEGPVSGAATRIRDLALLEEVQVELRAGNGARALELLDRGPPELVPGQLRAERLAAEVFAACQAGQPERARRAARAFLREHPATPATARVRSSCVGADLASDP